VERSVCDVRLPRYQEAAVIARLSAWQAVGVLIYAGLACGLLGLVLIWPPIFDRLERWADKRSEDDE
jgi:hypothetical protein